MSSALFLLLALSPLFVFTYNIDTRHAIVYEDPEPHEPGNYFGYSVALSFRNDSEPKSNLFVGAPRYSDETGKVYRCSESKTENGSTPECRGLKIAPAPTEVKVKTTEPIYLQTKKTGWLGASMSTGEFSNLTVCAPRSLTVAVTYDRRKVLDRRFLIDMRGYCFDVPDALGDILYRDDDILTTELRYPHPNPQIHSLTNSMYGFSIDYAVEKMNPSERVDRIVGQPRLNKVEIKRGSRTLRWNYRIDQTSNFGYSVSLGYYFDNTTLVFVAGVPGWMRKGKVTIIELPYNSNKYIEGEVLGEYFGASLATGDFDGDGLDDLAVGAPHWGEVDFGQVYTFYGSSVNTFDKGLTLPGKVDYGMFGYTLAAADLDNDKFSDLIVSAPWEGSGVVYVFYGSPNFRSKDSSAGITQRIEALQFQPSLVGFGFALSHAVDIDENGYPDLAIGAYKSGHAVVLRSRPVIKTKLQLLANPGKLQPSPGQNFSLGLCVMYTGEKAPETQEFQFVMTLDGVHKRVKGESVRNFPLTCNRDAWSCKNDTIKLTDEANNFVDPIPISVTQNIKEKVASDESEFCRSCPVLGKEAVEEIEETVYFNTGCNNSTNGTICNAHLSVNASFGGNRTEWVVGSGDVSLNINVTNTAEPAFLTKLTITLPVGIRPRNVETSCMIIPKTIEEAITLVCQIGNPLGKNKWQSLRIDLDMGQIEELVGGTVLPFKIKRFTLSEDHGTDENPITLNLNVKNQAWMSLTGLADYESQDYRRAINKSTVPIRHTYYVLKIGVTPITKAKLTIDVPIAFVGRNNSFLDITDPEFTDSTGQNYTCSIYGDDSLIGIVSSLKSNNPFLQRRRRGTPDATDPSVTTMTDESKDDENDDDNNERGVTVRSRTTDRTMYLNCSTQDVLCVQVTCLFKLSKTSNDSGNIALNIVFNASAFYTSNQDSLTIKFNTNASVEIESPSTLDPTFIQSSNTTAMVSTMLYNIPEPQKLAGWVYPVSIVFGILLFCLLVFILYRVGFFKRPQKAEIKKAKDEQILLKVGGNDDPYNELHSSYFTV